MSLISINPANQPVQLFSGISVSATANVSGQPVRVSGQTLYLVSGQNNVQMSGQTVQLISGDTIQTIITDNSGTAISVLSVTADDANTTTPRFGVRAALQAFHSGNNQFARVNVRTSISGDGYWMQTTPREISTIGIRTRTHLSCTALSGGTVFSNGTSYKVLLKNISGNNTMVVGGVSGEAPTSGVGYELYPTEEMMVEGIINLNQIRVMAYTSGQRIMSLSWQ